MELIDTHAHLDFPQFDDNRDDVILDAKRQGVTIINSCLSREGFNTMKGYSEILLTIGCCPYRFDEFAPQYELISKERKSLIAVGEIGLDYYWIKDATKREQEHKNFISLLKLSKEISKPVIIHSRNAEKKALEIMADEKIEQAIMHCFSGSMSEAEEAVDRGYLISIPTNIVNSKQKQKFAKKIPLENIVLETDAPYLSPISNTINIPSNVSISAAKIAEISSIEIDEVARVTTENAKKMLDI